MKPELFHDLLTRAKGEEFGLVIETNSPAVLINGLRDYKKGKEEFAELMICLPSNPSQVIIVKKSVELDP